jgi:hypothetical protein
VDADWGSGLLLYPVAEPLLLVARWRELDWPVGEDGEAEEDQGDWKAEADLNGERGSMASLAAGDAAGLSY